MYDEDSKSLVVAIYVHPSCIKFILKSVANCHTSLFVNVKPIRSLYALFDVVFFMHMKLADPTKTNMILLSHITRKYISYISQKNSYASSSSLYVAFFTVHPPSNFDRL